jgi:hypothetical protein
MTNSQLNILFGSSLVLIATLTITSHMEWMGRIKASSDIENAKAETLSRQISDAKIAEQRFRNGCVKVGIANGKTPVQISQDMAIYGHSAEGHRNPLADGTVVCDEWGGTGVMQGGRVVQFASSPQYKNFQQ